MCVRKWVCVMYDSGLKRERDTAPTTIMTLCGFRGGWVDISWTGGPCCARVRVCASLLREVGVMDCGKIEGADVEEQ